MKSVVYTLLYLLIIFGLATSFGCTVGPKYSRPQTPADTNETFYHSANHITDLNSISDNYKWWLRFADLATSSLVEDALQSNFDLKVAAARLLHAQAQYRQATGATLPQVSYNLQRSRNKSSYNFGTGRISGLTTTFQQAISVNYALDLFGKLKHSKRAAWGNILSASETQNALIHSLIANVINARINIAVLQRRRDLAEANTKSLQKTLNIVKTRYNKGLVGSVDLRLARENVAAAQVAEPQIQLSLAQAYHTLDILLGRKPGNTKQLPKTLSDLPDLSPIPVGMPASLLDRRPDVRVAEINLKAANEQIGVSIAQLYPDLTLTANWGRSADRWRDIWVGETEIYSLVTQFAQPIFAGGQLQAGVDAARARYSELAATYAKTVLTAIKEVEDALVSEELLKEQLNYAQLRVKEARQAEQLSRERYKSGVANILTVLESERRRRTAEDQLAVLKGNIWTTRVNLFLALGGDWIHKKSVGNQKG